MAEDKTPHTPPKNPTPAQDPKHKEDPKTYGNEPPVREPKVPREIVET